MESLRDGTGTDRYGVAPHLRRMLLEG
jgi:hypothetical protein